MLDHLRRFVRALYELPVVGGLVLWAAVALRLPTLQRRQFDLALRQVDLALRQTELAAHQKRTEEAAAEQVDLAETNAQVAQFAKRLEAVEAMLARIDAAAQENLVVSVPVALRRSAREIAQLRAQIGQAPCTVPDESVRERA